MNHVPAEKDISRMVEGLKRGSYNDFNRLYSIYADTLYGFVLSLMKSPSSAEDILQETFMRIWDRRNSLDPSQSFRSYIYIIARNLILDGLRKQLNNADFEEYMLNYAHPMLDNNVEDAMNFDDFTAKLAAAKSKLTPRQKLVFELSKEAGYKNTEIARMLECSEKTVRNVLSSAMKILRTEFSITDILILCLMMNLFRMS